MSSINFSISSNSFLKSSPKSFGDNPIVEYMKSQPIDEFCNSFLVWFCENFGMYWRSEKPCESCGDYSEIYELTI